MNNNKHKRYSIQPENSKCRAKKDVAREARPAVASASHGLDRSAGTFAPQQRKNHPVREMPPRRELFGEICYLFVGTFVFWLS